MTNNNSLTTVNQAEVSSWEDMLEREAGAAPLVDIYETNDDFVLVANMPGVNRENVKLKMEENALSIFGKIDYETTSKRNYILNENEIGHFYRKFRISNGIDDSKVEAKFENGQLVVKLPKHDRLKPRTIKIS
jgi:HSP20 family protein